MIKNIPLLSLIIFTLLFSNAVNSQLRNDVNQYMMYQPLVNYASASSYEELSAALYYRNQWVGFEGAPVNYALQVALPLTAKNSSFGLRFIRDEIGVRKTDVVSLNYGYRVKLTDKSYLSFSLSPKIGFLKETRSQLTAENELDPLTGNDLQKNGLFNAEIGTYYFRNNFYLGGAVPSLLRNNLIGSDNVDTYFDFTGLEWFIHSGYEWKLKGRNHFNVSGLFKSDKGASLHGEVNLMYQMNDKRLGVGASYRTTKALVALVKFSMFEKLSLSYSYQYDFSDLAKYQNGSHELMLIFERRTQRDLVKINVPRF